MHSGDPSGIRQFRYRSERYQGSRNKNLTLTGSKKLSPEKDTGDKMRGKNKTGALKTLKKPQKVKKPSKRYTKYKTQNP